ncbi:unnamed protein product [Effrenium voratum]|nr:unnamed protein product [Effrenium voratum]
MYADCGKGRQTLFDLWAKSGGVKAVFLEKTTLLTVKERSKLLEVKGGFYSAEDMKAELGYSAQCEYDNETTEFWVNIRTSGTLSKRDLQQLSREQQMEGEANIENAKGAGDVNFDWDFEGDEVKVRVAEYLKQLLKAKNSLASFCDKLRPCTDHGAPETLELRKIEGILEGMDSCYETLAESQAEGQTSGWEDKQFLPYSGT